MSCNFTDKDVIRNRIAVTTELLEDEATSPSPDLAKIAALERQIAADQKVLADIVIAESEHDIEVKRLEVEARKVEVESEKVQAEQTRNDIEIAKANAEARRARMEWIRGVVQIAAMAITSIIAVVLPVWFDYYKEGRVGERFASSQITEGKTAYLTMTDKEVVRQGLQDNTGSRKGISLPWK